MGITWLYLNDFLDPAIILGRNTIVIVYDWIQGHDVRLGQTPRVCGTNGKIRQVGKGPLVIAGCRMWHLGQQHSVHGTQGFWKGLSNHFQNFVRISDSYSSKIYPGWLGPSRCTRKKANKEVLVTKTTTTMKRMPNRILVSRLAWHGGHSCDCLYCCWGRTLLYRTYVVFVSIFLLGHSRFHHCVRNPGHGCEFCFFCFKRYYIR